MTTRIGDGSSDWRRNCRSDLVGGVILGSQIFAQQFLKRARAAQTEPAETNRLARAGRVEWRELVRRAEKVLGRRWTTMLEGRQDWGRDAVMYVAVRHGRYRLAEVVRQIRGLSIPQVRKRSVVSASGWQVIRT